MKIEKQNAIFEIKSTKQDNGLWGMPLSCVKIDKIVMDMTKENHLKYSAICVGIAEKYPDETFEIFWSDKDKFFIKLSKSGMKRIILDDYILVDNILTWVHNES